MSRAAEPEIEHGQFVKVVDGDGGLVFTDACRGKPGSSFGGCAETGQGILYLAGWVDQLGGNVSTNAPCVLVSFNVHGTGLVCPLSLGPNLKCKIQGP